MFYYPLDSSSPILYVHHDQNSNSAYAPFLGITIVGGKVVIGGSRLAAILREFWISS